MATVKNWNPFGVALNITADNGGVTRISASKFQVRINASWSGYWVGAQTNYGMSASSGGGSVELNKSGNYASNGNGSFTGTYSISGYVSQKKTITVTFRNFNDDNGKSATNNVSFDVTVPAWTSYTVSYNANGGSGAPASQTKWKDVELTLSSTKPTRTGYTFNGWSTTNDSTVEYNPGSTYTGNGNLTLYAVWTANNYTYNVVYRSSSGKSLGSTTVTHAYGGKYTVSSPAKAGYDTPSSQNIAWDKVEAKTITFTYSLVSYNITYNLNGGTVSGNPSSYNIESSTITLKNPTREGYNFLGWTGSNGSTPSASVSIGSGSTGNKSYTANWKNKTYTVSFNANLGEPVSNMPDSFTKTHWVDAKIPSNIPTARRYEFLGWATSATGLVQYQPGSTYRTEGNAILHAIWKLRASVINFYDGNGTRRNGLVHIYNDSGELHYGIMFTYDSNGNVHEVI